MMHKYMYVSGIIQEPYVRPDYTFKVVVRGISKKCSAQRQQQLYEVCPLSTLY